MEITSSGARGNFVIKDSDLAIAELNYHSWMSSSATLSIGQQTIELKPQSIWTSKFDIFKDSVDKGDIIFNWKGQMIIRLQDKKFREEQWMVKARGFWSRTFELIDEHESVLLCLKPSINWSRMGYDYEVELVDEKFIQNQDKFAEVLSYMVFAVNLFMRQMAGAG